MRSSRTARRWKREIRHRGRVLWNWFRRKRQSDDDLRDLAEQLLGPQALAAALAETVRDYVDAVQAGKLELLACFLDDRAHLEMPQPRGAVRPDTIQGMFQVYLYLDAAGKTVDPEGRC